VSESVTRAIELYAESHGLSVEEAVARVAAGAEAAAEILVVSESKVRAMAFLEKCEAELKPWTVHELGKAAGVVNGSQMLKYLRADGLVVDGEREIHARFKGSVIAKRNLRLVARR
jgi:hypothetical protein